MSKDQTDAAQCAVQLRRSVSLLARRLRPNLQHAGISVAKLSVLGQLHRNVPLTPTDLAAREGVRPQTLTRLLAELEADGWIARAPHASDRRQTLLALTPAGARRLRTATQAGDAVLAHLISSTLGHDERALLLHASALLNKLESAMADGDGAGKPAAGQASP